MVTEKPLILVVDDESDSLAFLFDLLHNEGYRVLPASSPLDALELVVKRKPSLIISDLRMPVMDGLELIRQVQALLGHQSLQTTMIDTHLMHKPVIAVTSPLDRLPATAGQS